MSNVDRLYNLLPLVYRQRDLEQGYPLQMLLRVISEQVDLIEGDIAQLYDNWFIETCQDWVVPYIADLMGYRPVHPLSDPDATQSSTLAGTLVPRREVANTIEYRRRKGTLSLLSDLAGAVTRWPARVVDFDRRVSVCQSLDHLDLGAGRYADLHAIDSLDRLGAPFDALSHSVDLRAVGSPYSQGRYNIPSVAVFLWRLNVYSVTHSRAYNQEEAGDHCFTFSILGNDAPLYNQPSAGVATGVTKRQAEELQVPEPIRRLALAQEVEIEGKPHVQASEQYYGTGKSINVWAPRWAGLAANQPIPAAKVIPADLAEWRYRPKPGHVALDPQLGRIAFPVEQVPEHDVWVSYAYGFSADIGGGEYPRPETMPGAKTAIYNVGAGYEFSRIHQAYERWLHEKPSDAVIEIMDSNVYEEQLHIVLRERQHLELRAANGARPVIYLLDWHASRPDALTVTGEAGSQFTLDGFLVTGRGIEFRGPLQKVSLRHSTLVPGWALHHDCNPRRQGEPSLALVNTSATVTIANSILGSIQIFQERDDVDPVRLAITGSMLDATRADFLALAAREESIAPAVLTIDRCTVFGHIQTHSILLAQNCIFTGNVMVARRQQGCMRFCYVPAGSRTPRRFHCQPDLADSAVAHRTRNEGLSSQESKALVEAERIRVTPEFLSTRYGSPDYGRLADICALEIRTGADDRSELGVFHDLFQPQQESNLLARLEEYTPAGIDAGIIFAT